MPMDGDEDVQQGHQPNPTSSGDGKDQPKAQVEQDGPSLGVHHEPAVPVASVEEPSTEGQACTPQEEFAVPEQPPAENESAKDSPQNPEEDPAEDVTEQQGDDPLTKKRKTKNERRNIKEIISDDLLSKEVKEAQAEEEARLRRLAEHRQRKLEAIPKQHVVPRQVEQENARPPVKEAECVDLSSDEEDVSPPEQQQRQAHVVDNDDDDCVIVERESEDEDGDESDSTGGLHANDRFNVRDDYGNVVINVSREEGEPAIHLAPQLSRVFKPHQIGGVRFLYDNIIESTTAMRNKNKSGFGCILAHSMGLGKTIQVVAFCDIFLRHTVGNLVLCIVPINTLQNWLCEFDHWLPSDAKHSGLSVTGEVRPRSFKVFVLNDLSKNLEQRAKIIYSWRCHGGVLLMGYELYRQLANKKITQRKRKLKRNWEGGNILDIVDVEADIQSRDLLDNVYECLVNPGPDLVICDEGHRIKNQQASISKALKSIRTKRRIVLTGYPLQNNLMEYWCMVDFVRPNFLGTKVDFANQFERPIQNGQCLDSTRQDIKLMRFRAHVLHTKLKGFVQRRGHDVLKTSLPPKSEHIVLVRMTPIQRRLYATFIDDLRKTRQSFSAASVSYASSSASCNPLIAFSVCCKIWNHPDVLLQFLKKRKDTTEVIDLDVEDDAVKKPVRKKPDSERDEISYDWAYPLLTKYKAGLLETSTKFIVFFRLLEETLKANDRMLVFSQSLMTLDVLEEFLHKKNLPGTDIRWRNGLNYFRLDGSTSSSERERLITTFNKSHLVKLFIVSTRAGSLGINLVGANRVVVLDASWNPCHDSQAVCRVYRYGQSKPCHIYRLVMDNSIEKKIYDRQINKQGMSDRIVDESNPESHFSSKELQTLISSDEHDPPADLDLASSAEKYSDDPVLETVVRSCGKFITREPFAHESLLIDHKELKLSKAEKRIAERNYENEQAISYARNDYSSFYPKDGAEATNLHIPGSSGVTRQNYSVFNSTPNNGAFNVDNPYLSVNDVPLPDPPAQTSSSSRPKGDASYVGGTKTIHDDVLSESMSKSSNQNFPMEALARQGVVMDEVTLRRDLNLGGEPPICLKAGQKVMVIKTLRGVYLRLSRDRILKLKLPQEVQEALGQQSLSVDGNGNPVRA